MMLFNEWKNNIVKILEFISTKDIQFEQWILKKNNHNCTDANELICMLYDDNFFEEFINHIDLSKNESKQLHKFNNLLNEFLVSQPEVLNEEDVYNNSLWDIIRTEAKQIVKELEKE